MTHDPLGSDDLLRLQRDALELILHVVPGVRLAYATGMKSIGDFDQAEAAVAATGTQYAFAEVWQRWPGREGMLTGAAVGMLVGILDGIKGPEVVDAVFAKAKERLAQKQSPFG